MPTRRSRTTAGKFSASAENKFGFAEKTYEEARETNEGSIWEAALFAGHHRLSNLTALIDVNGQQEELRG